MPKLKQKNTKKQGDVGLGSAIAYFSGEGFTVSIPLTDSQDYDLVVDSGGGLKRLQVKTTTQRSKSGEHFVVSLRVNGGNRSGRGKAKIFDWRSCELIYVLDGSGARWLIPTAADLPKSELTLSGYYSRFCLDKPVGVS